jgi:hypothetical protein
MAPDIEPLCRAGLWFKNVRKLRLQNIDISDHVGPAVRIADAEDVNVGDVDSRPTAPSEPAVDLQRVIRVEVRGS